MIEAEIVKSLPEIIVGIVLIVLSWSFKSWSNAIKDSTTNILEKLEALAIEFHTHRIDYEKRATKLEVEFELLEKRISRAGINGGSKEKE
jgi:hypothetical protein